MAAWAVAAAAGMTFLLPPGEADAYHYFSHGGHFDHEKKEQIVMSMGTVDYMPPAVYDAWTQSAHQWNIWTTDSIKITTTVDYAPRTNMTMRASWLDDPDWRYLGYMWPPDYVDGRSHWKNPGTYMVLNVGRIEREYAQADRRDLTQAVAVHEVGHSLGLAHTPEDSGCSGVAWNEGIMQDGAKWFYDECGFTSPQSDDIKGVNNLYRASSK